MANPSRVDPATDIIEYTAAATFPATSRHIRIYLTDTTAAASITLTMANGTTRALTVKDGWEMAVNATAISSLSNIAKVQASF